MGRRVLSLEMRTALSASPANNQTIFSIPYSPQPAKRADRPLVWAWDGGYLVLISGVAQADRRDFAAGLNVYVPSALNRNWSARLTAQPRFLMTNTRRPIFTRKIAARLPRTGCEAAFLYACLLAGAGKSASSPRTRKNF
ncbi:MAG: hypothetical protein LBG72_03040 [Spirochaetaceae bacterium]|nr:hypothetical protein [Spirochaetaceae bacterium]